MSVPLIHPHKVHTVCMRYGYVHIRICMCHRTVTQWSVLRCDTIGFLYLVATSIVAHTNIHNCFNYLSNSNHGAPILISLLKTIYSFTSGIRCVEKCIYTL